MAEWVETIVVGAGQAGLATSWHLTQQGRDHVVLEGGGVANTWRTQRWDGFYLNTPNWSLQLPGHQYDGPEPDGFGPLADAIAYLDEYARRIPAPVRTSVYVSAIAPGADGSWVVHANDEELEARNVVVATGAFQRPHLPFRAPEDVFELHAVDYRRPDQLPDGAVLVVGSGQTGCQIAEELLGAGRTVYLAVGNCPWFPRRIYGRDVLYWMLLVGLMDQTVDTLPSPAARLACNPALSGNEGGHDCNPKTLAARGAVLVGRVAGIADGRVAFAPGLEQTLAKGDEFEAGIRKRVDDYVSESGDDVAVDDVEPVHVQVEEIGELELSKIGSILWTTGYRPDFGWIDVPLDDGFGWPTQTRGVTSYPGLYFVGLNWMHKRKSALFFGVGEDAEHVVSLIAG
jgi:putative flavoprotein involved in K+ transport